MVPHLFSLSVIYLYDHTLQIIGDVASQHDRMVRRLSTVLDEPEPLMRVVGCRKDDLHEQIPRHIFAAGTGDQRAARP